LRITINAGQSILNLFVGYFLEAALRNGHGVLLVPINRSELSTAGAPEDTTLVSTTVEILFLLLCP
jgi:hypothetical protein